MKIYTVSEHCIVAKEVEHSISQRQYNENDAEVQEKGEKEAQKTERKWWHI